MNQAETSKPPQVRLSMPSKGMAQWPTIRKVLQQMASQLGFRLEIDGAESAEQTGDGLRFKLGGGQAGDHPWKGVFRGGGLTILGGFANDIPIANYTIGSGTGHAYLELNFSLDVEDLYVYGSTLTGASLHSGSSVPSGGGSTFYVPLFSYVGSRVVQSAKRNLRAQACDDGTGSGNAVLNILQI